MTRILPIRVAFLLSGMAGLTYEVLWTRYLGLFVGHGAYAQVLVLAVYLGGIAVGSFAVAERSKSLDRPLLWYAGAEVVLGAFGLLFHPLFVAATAFSYDVLFPAAGTAGIVGSIRWAVAGALILPQAIVLGTTFPLMAAGLVRAERDRPGGGVALAYLLNTLGGAAGVLLAGFWMIGAFGLPGTSVAAAVLNLGAAALVWSALRWGRPAEGVDGQVGAADDGTRAVLGTVAAAAPGWAPPGTRLPRVLLTVSLGTAVASFAYEIGWIRMLSLVLGSATHAFELMLSAFILGIALGAWTIRRRADESGEPVRLLGMVQLFMGLTALLSLPVYLLTLELMPDLVRALTGRAGGYELFNLSRYGLCLLVMLPSTILAGTTLPLITGALLRAGAEERTIGHVYGVNTIGSVVGAGLAGLIGLPLLGLKGLVTAGAALDVALGIWLLERAGRWSARGRRLWVPAAGACLVVFLAVGATVEFAPDVIAGGVYASREGTAAQSIRSLFYQDGRTATVSAHVGATDGVVVLATNGKPDASMGPRFVARGGDTLPTLPVPAGRDYTTQILAPIVGVAHRPDARTAANVGHGSGMTATSLLTSSALERLVTIEIEPLMVEGSLVFLPANGPAFADPRVTYVFDDAKSFFSYRRERFDIIFAEPSNPWVSGTASLFTREFYERVAAFMGDGGVFTQWVQIYEIDDDLFLSVLAALDEVFPSYRAYLVGDADVAIVASLDGPLDEPDWSVVESERFVEMTRGVPRFRPQHLEALLLFDENTFRAVLDGTPSVPVNSDYRPILDLGAERTRFEQRAALGVYSLGTSRVDLTARLSGRERPRHPFALPPAYGLTATVLTERGAWLRGATEAGGGIAPEEFPEWDEELVHLQTFLLLTGADRQLGSWETWASGFVRAENALHWGTTGWVDPTLYRNVFAFLDRAEAPPEARAAVDLLHGYALSDWPRAAAASDRLVTRVAAGERWSTPDLLMDIAVLAYLEVGRPDAARNVIELLETRTGRAPDHGRTRLLRALVDRASAR